MPPQPVASTTPQSPSARARPPRERAPPSAFRSSTLNSGSGVNVAQDATPADGVPPRATTPTGVAATAAAVAATAGSRRSSIDSLSRDRNAVDRGGDSRDVQSSNGHSQSYAGSASGGHHYGPGGMLNGGYQYPPAPSPPPGAQPMPMPMPYAGQGYPVQQYPGGYVPAGAAQQYAAVPTTPSQGQFANMPPSPGMTSQAPTPRPHNAFMSNSAIARASASSSAVDLAPFASRITGTAPNYGGHSRRESYVEGVRIFLAMQKFSSFVVILHSFILSFLRNIISPLSAHRRLLFEPVGASYFVIAQRWHFAALPALSH